MSGAKLRDEDKVITREINKILHNIEEDLDNLNVYTIYMGPGQSDRVCVDFAEVMEIMQKHHRKEDSLAQNNVTIEKGKN